MPKKAKMPPKTPGTDTFSLDDDIKLVELVKTHPFLFDMQHEHAKNMGIRDIVWKDISDEMRRSGEDCKKRWKNIKDTYNKIKRNKKLRSGQSSNSKPSKWALAESLTFLDDCSNDQQNEQHLTLAVEKDSSSSSSQGDEDDCVIVAEDQRLKLINNSPLQSTIKDQARLVNCKDTKRQLFNLDGRNSKKAKRNEDMYLSFSSGHDEVIRIVDDKEDPLNVFFKCMALTVKKFPPHLQIKAKQEIFRIITNLEIENNKPVSK